MGQVEILGVLKKNGGWMFVAEIQRELNQNRSLISRSLRKLKNQGEIVKKEILIGKRRSQMWKIKDGEKEI